MATPQVSNKLAGRNSTTPGSPPSWGELLHGSGLLWQLVSGKGLERWGHLLPAHSGGGGGWELQGILKLLDELQCCPQLQSGSAGQSHVRVGLG